MTSIGRTLIGYIFCLLLSAPAGAQVLVLQSDFGVRDAAVAAMKLVILGVDNSIRIVDNTHDIEPFQIYEGAYRLYQSAPLAAPGTVFVSVVDPGVGSQRLSIVAQDKRGVLYVTPDNGTLSFIQREIGLNEVRIIDEMKHRRAGSEKSHTFHGRDVYAFIGAKLASGQIDFSEVGEKLAPDQIVMLPTVKAEILDGRLVLSGIIEIHDVRFGNLWTNIPEALAREFGFKENETYSVRILKSGEPYLEFQLPFLRSFAGAKELAEKQLLYMNSLGKVACAELVGSMARNHEIGFGTNWTIEIRKLPSAQSTPM